MKKVLSLILAIVMIAMLVPASLIINAVDVVAGNKNDNMVVTDGTYTVENDSACGVFVLGESENWEVTMDMKNAVGNAEFGLQICGKDNNGDGLILEGDDSFLQLFMTGCDSVRIIGCDKGWGNVAGYQWDDVIRTTGRGAKDDLTLTVKLNGNKLSYWVDGVQLGDTITLDKSAIFGNVVTLFMKHTNTSISNVSFKDNGAAVVEPETVIDTKEETVYGATNGEASWVAGEIATVTKKYFAVSFTMKAAAHAGIIADNGCCGLMFGNNDDTCIFIPYDGTHTATQRGIGIDGHAAVVCGKWWGESPFGVQERTHIDEYVDQYVTILALGTMNDDGTATISAYVNGKQIKVWGGATEATAAFNGKLQWAIRLNNVSADVKFMQSDSPMLVIAPEGAATMGCTDDKVTVPVNVLQNPGVNILLVTPKLDNFDFKGVESQQVSIGEIKVNVLVSEVFSGYDCGLNAVFDINEGNTTATGKLANFIFETSKKDLNDPKLDIDFIEAYTYEINDVPTFIAPTYIAKTHGEGKEIVDDSVLVSGATCTSKAVYHKTCDCGVVLADTFEAGELAPHTWVENAEEKYLVTPASCASKAVYAKSCSVCGAKGEETFEAGEPTGNHNYAGDWRYDETDHWQNCGCGAEGPKTPHEYDNDCDTDCNICGATRTITHNFVENAEEKYLKTPASCVDKAVYYKSCSVCGEKSEETFEAGETTDHTFGEWKHDDDKHWKECAGCGAKDAEDAHEYDNDCDTDCNICGATRTITHNFVENPEEKYLKTPASCATKAVYYKSCSVCGEKSEETFEYGEPTDDHNFAGDWKFDETNHWQNCGCGAEGPKTPHEYDNDCDTDCNICGATRTITHNWEEKVAEEFLKDLATCATKAVYYKSCSVCGAESEETFEAGETTDHTFGEWKHDNDKHWKECAGCGAKDAEAAHAYGEGVVTKEPTTTEEGEKTFTCECGATKTEKIDKLPEEVAPKTGSTTALIAAVALLSVTAGAAVVITRKKREI